MLQYFGDNSIPLVPQPGKMEQIYSSFKELRERRSRQAILAEIMDLGGKLFLFAHELFRQNGTRGIATFLSLVIGTRRVLFPTGDSWRCLGSWAQ